MIVIGAVLIILACGYAQYRNGLFTSFAMLIMVFISGTVAFGFWEPIADLLDPAFENSTLAGTEDMIVLVTLFSVTLFALRLALSYLSPEMIEEHGWLQHFGGAAVGLLTGYFVAGFLICAMQTLPLDEHFMGFTPRADQEPGYRTIFPADRVWLALMRHAGAYPLCGKEDLDAIGGGGTNVERYPTFDRNATFELRYLRYRRGTETRGPMPYFGEFDRELGRNKAR